MDYRRAGVNLEEAAAAKRAIASHARTTFTDSVLRDVGHFGGFFRLPEPGPLKPVLVASSDGVGTKLLLAGRLNQLEGVGEDLVHHCINDILTCGAVPLFFLDYMAFGKLESGKAETSSTGTTLSLIRMTHRWPPPTRTTSMSTQRRQPTKPPPRHPGSCLLGATEYNTTWLRQV